MTLDIEKNPLKHILFSNYFFAKYQRRARHFCVFDFSHKIYFGLNLGNKTHPFDTILHK